MIMAETGGDSNPRIGCPTNAFRERSIQIVHNAARLQGDMSRI